MRFLFAILLLLAGLRVFANDMPREFYDINASGIAGLLCPMMVVCDENYDYHAYSFKSDSEGFYLFFNGEIVNGYSLEAFRSQFNYLWFEITLGDDFRWQSQPIRDVVFTQWENGVLTGYFETLAGGTAFSPEAQCSWCCMGDCDEFYRGCTRPTEERHIRVNFSLSLPEPDIVVGKGR